VAVERRAHTAGSLRLHVVPDASWRNLGPFLRGGIDADEATVVADDWRGYAPLAAAGVSHEPIPQIEPVRAVEILPWAHVVTSNLETWLRGTFHGVSPAHLQRGLVEFTYRFNRCWREEALFHFMLRRAAERKPLPSLRLTAELIGKVQKPIQRRIRIRRECVCL